MGEDSDIVQCSLITTAQTLDLECDALLVSSDGIPFNAHKQILCDASELFEAFFAERWNAPDCKRTKYESKNIDSQVMQIILDEIYGKRPEVPTVLVLPLLQASEFLLLKSHRLRRHCDIVIAREPFAALDHQLFYPEVVNNSSLVDSILKADLLLTNAVQLRRILFSWASDDAGFVDIAKNRLRALSRKTRDVAYFYDRGSRTFFGFTGNRCFQWRERDYAVFPEDAQHQTITDSAVLYATSSEIRDCCSGRALYIEQADIPWPPLLRRYGKVTVWSEENRRKIRVRWVDPRLRRDDTVLRLRSHSTIVRHIAAVDTLPQDCLVVVVTQDGKWKVLKFDAINTPDRPDDFEDLNCPLKRVDAVAVLNDMVYVLGNETMSHASDKLLAYQERNREWFPLQGRLFEEETKSFFPLNGRLYVACNGREFCEVYEPSIDRWMVTDFYCMGDIGGCTILPRDDF